MNSDFVMFVFSIFFCCMPVVIASSDKIVEFAVCSAHWIMNTFCSMIKGFVVAAGSVCRVVPEKRERRAAEVERSIAALEIQSAKWTEIRMSGGDPVWHEVHGWTDAADICPCGYVTECAVWCGPGHENGRCSGARHGYPVIGFTAVEFSNGIRQAFRNAGGAM